MLLAFLQLGCSTGNSYRYKIGVSQCVGGPWRDKVNNEMLSAQHLYDTDVEVTIVDANNNNARQCEQIDSMAIGHVGTFGHGRLRLRCCHDDGEYE